MWFRSSIVRPSVVLSTVVITYKKSILHESRKDSNDMILYENNQNKKKFKVYFDKLLNKKKTNTSGKITNGRVTKNIRREKVKKSLKLIKTNKSVRLNNILTTRPRCRLKQ